MPPMLKKVIRLDSTPLMRTHFTEEGYLKDRPILTSTGIFEYVNSDGSIRRELRLPEEVFRQDSLDSYKGKPIILTHGAGLVTKDNVRENTIGTILSSGIKSGDDVRADIIIHDTDEMKNSGFKELSLGYNLDLEETPGVWKGQQYDAIQRNIKINHLALVREARAGEQARLNIDSKDSNTLIGGKKSMALTSVTHADGLLNEQELEEAIAQYKERRAKAQAVQKDAKPEEKLEEEKKTVQEEIPEEIPEEAENVEETPKEASEEIPEEADEPAEEPVEKAPEEEVAAEEPAEEPIEEEPVEKADPTEEEEPEIPEEAEEEAEPEQEEIPDTIEGKIEHVNNRRNMRDEHGDPTDMKDAMYQIAEQDEDIDMLHDIIDTLLAEREFVKAEKEQPNMDSCDDDDEYNEDEEEEIEDDIIDDTDDMEDEEEEFVEDEDDEEDEDTFRKDSIDEIVNTRIKLGMLGRRLNMDGLENYPVMEAKKMIIKKVRPSMNLDGKSDAFINGAYDLAVDVIGTKDTNYQKQQMFNKDSKDEREVDSSEAARKKMIERMHRVGGR